MQNSRTKNYLLIMSSGMLQQIISLIFSFISRTIFIKTLGENYLGLNGLFTNILQIFSLAELGVGSAITFYMYKPIANKDTERIKTLMSFYKVCYRAIGLGILIIGLCLLPFLNKLVNFNTIINVNMYFIYFLYLLNSVITYLFFSYKFSIITAHQQGYIINIINCIFIIISCICESTVLIMFKAFEISLLIKLVIGLLKNLVTSIAADNLYPYLKEKNYSKISQDEVKKIFKDIYSIFIFRISSTLFQSTDNIAISIMFGTVYVGYNSNYVMIINAIRSIVGMISNSFTAAVGNINASESTNKKIITFKNLDFINFWIVSFCSVCLFQLLNPFITLWIGKKYIFTPQIVFLIVLDLFIVLTLNIVFQFRETMGLFKYGKYRQLVGGIVNIILDIVLGKLWGVAGIFAATVISKLLITVFPFPKIIYKYGFHKSPNEQYKRMLGYYITTFISGSVTWLCCSWVKEITIGTFFIEMIICIVIPNFILFIFYNKTKRYKYLINKIKIILNNFKFRSFNVDNTSGVK